METNHRSRSNELPELSDNAREFLFAVHAATEVWHTWMDKREDGTPLTTLDRLRGLAAHILLIIDSDEYHVLDAAYELRFGPDGEEVRDLATLLASVPPEEDAFAGDGLGSNE